MEFAAYANAATKELNEDREEGYEMDDEEEKENLYGVLEQPGKKYPSEMLTTPPPMKNPQFGQIEVSAERAPANTTTNF